MGVIISTITFRISESSFSAQTILIKLPSICVVSVIMVEAIQDITKEMMSGLQDITTH